jgi:hypothetical protein
MLMKSSAASLLFIGSLVASFSWVPQAHAAQATTTDLTDFIVRLGGWFTPADAANDPLHHYWVQESYALQSTASGAKPTGGSTQNPSGSNQTPGASNSPASGSNITTLVMTRTTLRAEDATGGASTPGTSGGQPTVGPPCTNDMTTTETITFDLRELQVTAPITQSTKTFTLSTGVRVSIGV